MAQSTALSRDILHKICLGVYPQDQTQDAILRDFIDVAKKLTESDHGSIFILEREDGEVHLVSHREEGDLLDELPNLLELDRESPGIVTWVYHNNQPYMANDVSKDPYYFPAFKEVRANLMVPIRLQGEAIGVLAVESVRKGNYTDEHRHRLEDLSEAISLVISRLWLKRYSRRRGYNVEIVGSSEAIRSIEATIKRVAPTREPVLLTGGSGTGKELLAHAIHYFSKRRDLEMLIVNCGAFAEDLLASELFGHVRGAFTGAHRDRAGKMELADGGTLFLDEVESMSPRLQVMVLRALEYGEIQKVGEDRRSKQVDVRIIAASNRDLPQLVQGGEFREDLYYRLNVFEIVLPALRERREDVPMLAEHFLSQFRVENGSGPRGFEPAALDALRAFDWPGNVRELRNAVRRAAVLSDGEVVRPQDLPRLIRESGVLRDPGPTADSAPGSAALATSGGLSRQPLDAVIADHIRRVVHKVDGNKSRAAEILGIPRTSLYHKIRKYGIEVDEDDRGT